MRDDGSKLQNSASPLVWASNQGGGDGEQQHGKESISFALSSRLALKGGSKQRITRSKHTSRIATKCASSVESNRT